jgi:NAD(P)-dependent dehydrogenase (short-subunit alcohol dehydrogenase family)
MQLKDKVAIVTGGGRGIGRATAISLALEGAAVTVSARTRAQIEETALQIRHQGGKAIAIPADVANESSVANMVSCTLETFGRIDILVNNAGYNLPDRNVIDLTLEEWNTVLTINLTGPFLCAKAVLPTMVKQRFGKIINIASIGGRQGRAARSPYRAAKAGLINFTQSLAAEVKRYGIDVNCVCPGGTDTQMMRVVAHSQGRTDLNLMRPEEIAAVVLFLASSKSSAITGTAIDAFGPSNPLFR